MAKVSFSNPSLKPGGGIFIPAKPTPKAASYPQSLSQRDAYGQAMNSAYKTAMDKGTLGIGFGGPAPKKTPQSTLQKQLVNPMAKSSALQAKKK